jgi:DNA polymerase
MKPAKAGSAEPFVPKGAGLSELRKAVQDCRGCELYRNATQAVFGEGGENAPICLIGEKPGDREDREGRPFVGPAGRLLHRALQEAGIDLGDVYITNAVKHFKFMEVGRKRLHKKPSGPEITACRPWLDAELDLIKPGIIVCLGATAAQSVVGREARVTKMRGAFLPHKAAKYVTSTLHPSALLRIPEQERRRSEYRLFVDDFKRVLEKLKEG